MLNSMGLASNWLMMFNFCTVSNCYVHNHSTFFHFYFQYRNQTHKNEYFQGKLFDFIYVFLFLQSKLNFANGIHFYSHKFYYEYSNLNCCQKLRWMDIILHSSDGKFWFDTLNKIKCFRILAFYKSCFCKKRNWIELEY